MSVPRLNRARPKPHSLDPTPGVPPLSQGWFHLHPIHTILDEWLGNFESYYEAPYLYSPLSSAYFPRKLPGSRCSLDYHLFRWCGLYRGLQHLVRTTRPRDDEMG